MAARALLSARRCVELSPTWPKVRSAMPMALLFALSSFIGAATGCVARWQGYLRLAVAEFEVVSMSAKKEKKKTTRSPIQTLPRAL